ncbi:MAG: ATP-binding protein [Polyangia bacterium]|jgi:predicted AAA+ superfamily ATPase|nr:ATP-binding protein [Polyangia bacterium]
MLDRAFYRLIWESLSRDKPMVLMAGPRQVGKTTLARQLAAGFTNSVYANWDIPSDRARIVGGPRFFTEAPRRDDSPPLVVLDEVHKQRQWKSYLKGIYDAYAEDYRFLVTGSGRLDLYQRGGDSLAGRYLLFHLWPFTLAELGGEDRSLEPFWRDPMRIDLSRHKELMDIQTQLEELSGFPEPFLSGRRTSYRRWSAAYGRQLVREDIRDLADVRAVTELETLYHLLPSRVGSPLSAASLARDLGVAYNTVQSWLTLLERFFLTFTVPTWTGKLSRAIRKDRKVYLLDTPRIEDPAARLENLVAIELRRAVSGWSELGEGDFSLHCVRTKEGREVDFLVADGRRPLLLVEVKLGDGHPDKGCLAIQRALRVPAVQLVRNADTYRRLENDGLPLLVAPACCWLAGLP